LTRALLQGKALLADGRLPLHVSDRINLADLLGKAGTREKRGRLHKLLNEGLFQWKIVGDKKDAGGLGVLRGADDLLRDLCVVPEKQQPEKAKEPELPAEKDEE